MGQQQGNVLLRSIEVECRATSRFTAAIQAFKAEVMETIARVPRQEFVPDHLKTLAKTKKTCPSETARQVRNLLLFHQ